MASVSKSSSTNIYSGVLHTRCWVERTKAPVLSSEVHSLWRETDALMVVIWDEGTPAKHILGGTRRPWAGAEVTAELSGGAGEITRKGVSDKRNNVCKPWDEMA